MRPTIIAGNWKMHKTLDEGRQLATSIIEQLKDEDLKDKQVILCPPFTHLAVVAEMVKSNSRMAAGAQNCYNQPEGAYTGEVSAAMIKSTGADYVILGHSERRSIFKENNQDIAAKVKVAIGHGLHPIFCCGEMLSDRNADKQYEVVSHQLQESLFRCSSEELKKVIIAYEPVWAIGTGRTASPEEAQEMHHFIRDFVKARYADDLADNLCILYGGSVKPENAASLFSQPDIDGGLIGGASLKADDFLQIVSA